MGEGERELRIDRQGAKEGKGIEEYFFALGGKTTY
jgi:hypothetical protein